MPERKTRQRAKKSKKEGKAATTQAGEYVREEMHHKKRGKHPVKSRKQAVAIGLSKARRDGVKVPTKSRSKSAKSTKSKSSHGARKRTRS